LRALFPTTQAWGALLPYAPSGNGVREGCDPLALSRGWVDGVERGVSCVPLSRELVGDAKRDF